ncbi:hypothetical protein [Thioclava pacifica]|uniref:Uncharacterized protein n=1 Tax=Thioclava pacifica DSM 10166 TaxID=1353537 RepID=A0A074JAV0_9RHOB|nr:hypothetical protein [Thioclava pacifica]KEO52693.1 hypothetical protein TP2_07055 [Thioclava pacifica DSM 10166]
MRRLFAPLLIALTAQAAVAEPAYLDNRSTPADLVRSLYNAIALHQYARAWSYFAHHDQIDDYGVFAKGYAETVDVSVEIGTVTSEAAAGSIYARVPVTVRSTQSDGSKRLYGGCYILRQIAPTIQEPPFTPLQIVTGHLLLRAPGEQAMPSGCDEQGRPQF